MNLTKRAAVAVAVAVLVSTLAGCSASREDSCTSLGAALSSASVGAVNAFARLDSNPEATFAELERIRLEFDEGADGWNAEVQAAADDFSGALETLTDATKASVSDGGVDGDAVRAAVADFEAAVVTVPDVCSPSPSPTTD